MGWSTACYKALGIKVRREDEAVAGTIFFSFYGAPPKWAILFVSRSHEASKILYALFRSVFKVTQLLSIILDNNLIISSNAIPIQIRCWIILNLSRLSWARVRMVSALRALSVSFSIWISQYQSHLNGNLRFSLSLIRADTHAVVDRSSFSSFSFHNLLILNFSQIFLLFLKYSSSI